MKRVLLVADAGRPTGFERVGRAIGTALQGSGEYEVVCRAIGRHADDPLRVPEYPYEVKPTGGDRTDPSGAKKFGTWVDEDKPDMIVLVQDLWTQVDYLLRTPTDIPKLGYYPVDAPNMKWSFAVAAAALDEAVPYTRFGAVETALGIRDAVDIIYARKELYGLGSEVRASRIELPRDQGFLSINMNRLAGLQNVSAYKPIAHGGEPEKFFPEDRSAARKMCFGGAVPDDAFVVMSVNTNQFRKRQDTTIRAFAWMVQHVPNAYLVLHNAGGNDRGGWDLGQLARLYGVESRVICTHWTMPELSEAQLRLLYNCADVHVNNGGGEGWGLSTHESALCGVAQLVPDWSATKELWEGAAGLLPVPEYRFEPKFLNTAHAIIDPKALGQRLVYLAQNPDARQALADACRTRALTFPTWTTVGEEFVGRVRQLEAPRSVVGLTMDEVMAHREGDLVSPLLERI